MSIDLLQLSSLAKVFPDEKPDNYLILQSISALKNEKVAFQIAYCSDCNLNDIYIEVTSPLSDHISVYHVGYVQTLKPCGEGDDYYLRKTPGIYPDILQPYHFEKFHLQQNQWRCFWFEIDCDKTLSAADYSIKIRFFDSQNNAIASSNMTVTIIDAILPPQTLVCTNWFHCDSLATYYHVPVFSEEFWQITENFIHTAVEHGINFILTPLFTPPLDTAVGSERLTVQLIDVTLTNGNYTFDFTNLKKWIAMCKRQKVQYYEISHLFTQWGAAHAPKIMATVDGEYKRIFGWETDATGKDYEYFLTCVAPELIKVLDEEEISDCTYFHVSDEPNKEALKTYTVVSKLMKKLFGHKFRILDALSDFEFYKKKLVTTPVPSIEHATDFYKKVPEFWTYYCCGPDGNYYTNRFFAMPSQRTRILGYMLYKYHAYGFLQWGYNFYFSHHALRPINPYYESDADGAFPAGDAYVVYPGDDGAAIPSIRLKVFNEALQDMRACQLLEQLAGENAVKCLIDENDDLSFNTYPHSEKWQIQSREKINQMISSLI